jgi:hypothetical protein
MILSLKIHIDLTKWFLEIMNTHTTKKNKKEN